MTHFTNYGTLYCPCCSARIDIDITESGAIYVAVHGILANKLKEKENAQEDLLSESIDGEEACRSPKT